MSDAKFQDELFLNLYENHLSYIRFGDSLGIHVPNIDRTYPYFTVYDFESILKIHEHITENLKWSQEHVPIAVSICSNVPKFTNPQCFVNENLLEDMFSYLNEIREGALPLLRKIWANL